MIETSVSRLRAKLGQFMRAVRSGKQVVITDRDRPVAKLVPYDHDRPAGEPLVSMEKDPASPRLGAVKVKSISYRGTSSTRLLSQDRGRR